MNNHVDKGNILEKVYLLKSASARGESTEEFKRQCRPVGKK